MHVRPHEVTRPPPVQVLGQSQKKKKKKRGGILIDRTATARMKEAVSFRVVADGNHRACCTTHCPWKEVKPSQTHAKSCVLPAGKIALPLSTQLYRRRWRKSSSKCKRTPSQLLCATQPVVATYCCVRFGFFITFVVSVTALTPNETAPSPNAFAIMFTSALPLRYTSSSACFDSEEYWASGSNVLGLLKERKLGCYLSFGEETTRWPS